VTTPPSTLALVARADGVRFRLLELLDEFERREHRAVRALRPALVAGAVLLGAGLVTTLVVRARPHPVRRGVGWGAFVGLAAVVTFEAVRARRRGAGS
jgi:hypothetical protein